MGAAYDLQCDNEQLEKEIKRLKRKLKQKEILIIELADSLHSKLEKNEPVDIITMEKVYKILNKQK